MSKESPFFKFDVNSWLRGTIQYCPLEEKGLFIDLVSLYWLSHEPVQIDAKFELRYSALQVDLKPLLVHLASLEMIHQNEAGVTIPFLDVLFEERQEYLKNCSKGGKITSALKCSTTIKKEERRKKKEDNREKKEDFEAFWILYPSHKSKQKCSDSWEKLSEEDKEAAMVGVKTFEFTEDAQYIPHGVTWINQRRWEDESIELPEEITKRGETLWKNDKIKVNWPDKESFASSLAELKKKAKAIPEANHIELWINVQTSEIVGTFCSNLSVPEAAPEGCTHLTESLFRILKEHHGC